MIKWVPFFAFAFALGTGSAMVGTPLQVDVCIVVIYCFLSWLTVKRYDRWLDARKGGLATQSLWRCLFTGKLGQG